MSGYFWSYTFSWKIVNFQQNDRLSFIVSKSKDRIQRIVYKGSCTLPVRVTPLTVSWPRVSIGRPYSHPDPGSHCNYLIAFRQCHKHKVKYQRWVKMKLLVSALSLQSSMWRKYHMGDTHSWIKSKNTMSSHILPIVFLNFLMKMANFELLSVR